MMGKIRRTLGHATRWLMIIATISTLAIVSGCNFDSEADAPNDVDRKILGMGGAALVSRINGQSAMIGTSCARNLGPRLAAMRAQNASIEEMRSELQRTCTTSGSQVQNANLAQRGRLFAPMRTGDGSSRHLGSSSGTNWYSWYWHPFSYWSPVVSDNVNFCRMFFGRNNYNYNWNDGTCFSLFYDFVSYQYFDSSCYRSCPVWGATPATGSGSSSSSGATAQSPVWNLCVSRRCVGQWYW